jgi:hypothetical protein
MARGQSTAADAFVVDETQAAATAPLPICITSSL